MDEDLKQRLLTALDALASRMSEGSDLVSEKLPVLAQEWINSYFYGGLLCIAIPLVVLAFLGAAMFIVSYVCGQHKDSDLFMLVCIATVVCLILSPIPVVFGAISVFEATVRPNSIVLDKITDTIEKLK